MFDLCYAFRRFFRLPAAAALLAALLLFGACGKDTRKTAGQPRPEKSHGQPISIIDADEAPSTTAGTSGTRPTSAPGSADAVPTSTTAASTTAAPTLPTAVSPMPEQTRVGGSLGTAGSLDGVTVVVSVYVTDETTRWNENLDEDRDMIEDTRDNLRIAADYLTEQAGRYDKTARFVWDWSLYADLRYDALFTENLVTEYGDMYRVQRNWVVTHIDSDALMRQYAADNIVYLFFFNTEYANQVNPWTLGYTNGSGCDVEFCNIYVRFDNQYIAPPATYAHEILHCFGAHDLYYANAYISQAYVDHCAETGSADIMYAVSDGKWIFNDFTDLDAYYVGLTDRCDEVDRWGLAQSEHLS